MATQPKPKPEPEPKSEPDEDQAAKQPPQRTEGASRQQSFGERAVGLLFNPSGDLTVHHLKELYAEIIDICHDKRVALMAGSEAHRLYSVAITEAQGAQMWAVKAATWKD